MQVKKFEARTVREALDLVKSQLGPDAIILSVRDNKKAYGLVGEGSIEITAAASEDSIRNRKAVESRLPQVKKAEFQRSPARMQKEIISQFVDHHQRKEHQQKSLINRKYIDIEDDMYRPEGRSDHNARPEGRSTARSLTPEQTSKTQAQYPQQSQRYYEQSREQQPTPQPQPAPPEDNFFMRRLSRRPAPLPDIQETLRREQPVAVAAPQPNHELIHTLQGEIKTLKQIINQFQQVPQKMQQSSYPGSDYGLPYELAGLFQKLTEHGVASEISGELLTELKESLPPIKLKNPALLEGLLAKNILDSVLVKPLPFSSRIQVFMGPPGSGKTSALVKLASHLIAKENKKIAFATADTFKVGAADQMRIYAQILNTSFSIIRSKNDWMNILKSAQAFDYLFVDYPGLTLRSNEENNLLERLLPPSGIAKDMHLVVSATDQDQYLTDAGARYQKAGFDDVIFNFLDETYHHGSVYNFQNRFKKPFLGFGLGNKIPEDFEFATPERVLDLVMKITQSIEKRMTGNDHKSL